MIRTTRNTIARRCLLCAMIALGLGVAASDALRPVEPAHDGRPDIVIVTVDTLRADRMSTYGYRRPTTPNVERLFHDGAWFDDARTVEPLTSPALCSMITARPPHEHGSSRNGLRMRAGLASLPKELRYHGYRSAAFVGNWTLRDKLSGLAEHFDDYHEVMTRSRWFGLVRGEATADDLNDRVIEWLDGHGRPDDRPVFLWVHYVEPHAPYRLWDDHAERLGIPARQVRPEDRYDTEIAYVDAAIGRLFARLDHRLHDPMIVFLADHGESLGEHDYWGHGRNLYEPTLRIPLAVSWRGRIPAGRIDGPALITDVAPTVLGLLGHRSPEEFRGFDWAGVLTGSEKAPSARITHYQAHRGAVLSRHESDIARRSGLLEVGLLDGSFKETFRVGKQRRATFDLDTDPAESASLTSPKTSPSEALSRWMRQVYAGLSDADTAATPEPLDDESEAALRSLGYVD